MRAAFITEFGDGNKLKVGDLPVPQPGPQQALVKVKAAALNHLDIWVRKGRPGLTLKEPHVLGSDLSGIVEKFGPNCDQARVKVGDEIVLNPGVSCMNCEFCLRGDHSECPSFRLIGFQLQGTYAEYAIVPAVNLFPKPASLNWEEAAALPLAHLTAWRMLFERVHLQAGETVLIHGIGGGVAIAALQLTQMAGAKAIVTSSSDAKLSKARQLGAIAGINYRSTSDIPAEIKKLTGGRGVDVAFDTSGAATLATSMSSLRRGGRIVTCGITSGAEAAINIQQLYWNHLSFLGSTMGSMEDMRRMLLAVGDKGIKPLIDKSYPLSEAPAAMARMEAGEQMGKIVLKIS